MIQLSQQLMRLHVSYVYCNDTRHLNHFVTRISCIFSFCSWFFLSYVLLQAQTQKCVSPASFLTSFHSSMDVQGDYDPCDASGFIRINAVRLVHIEYQQLYETELSVKRGLIHMRSPHTQTFNLILFPSCFPPQVKGTPPFAGFLQHQGVTATVL